MKKRHLCTSILFIALVYSSPRVSAQAFIHPGINQTRQDLDYMKQLVSRDRQPWKGAFERLVKATDTTYVPKPYAHVLRGPYAKPNIGGDALFHSAELAYNCALIWYVTGDRNYATTAIRILNIWSENLWDFDYNDAKLLSGWTGHLFCNAAEILRYSSAGWKKQDIDRFTGMLMTVYYPLLRDYFPTANGNWDGAICHSLLAIAIFTDNRTLFNNAVDHLLHGPVNGSIFKYIYPNGECQESPRDQGHVQLGLGEFAGAAQVAYTQGVDLFSIADDRIARGFEYTAGYILGHTPYCYCVISPRSVHLNDYYEYVYRHYTASGLKLPYVTQAADSMRPRASRKILASVRAAFAGNTPLTRTLTQDTTAYIAGADRDTAQIPADAVWVKPGESVQQALDASKGTGRWVVLARGLHRLSAPLRIPSAVTLAGTGSGSILFLDPEAGRDAVVNAADDLHDVTLRNFVIEGASEPQPGNDPNSSRSFRGKGNRGGILFRAAAVNLMHDIRMTNLTVRGCTYNGVFISGASNLEFSGCNFNENGGSVVPGPGLQHNLLLSHCRNVRITASRMDTSPFGSGIALEKCDSVTVTANELARNALHGISTSESKGITISGNLIEANDKSGIEAEDLHAGNRDLHIYGNRIHFNGGYAVVSRHTTGLHLGDNRWKGNGTFTGTISTKGQVSIDGKTAY